MGAKARAAAHALALSSTDARNKALILAAQKLRQDTAAIVAANDIDMKAARERGLDAAMLDRLELNPARVEAMAKGLDDIVALPDPVGEVMAQWERPNGLKFSRVRVPIGVIGVIYESRPNVTADAGALALKAGNAAILRGGSDSFRSSAAIVACLKEGLDAAGLPPDAIQSVPTRDRAAVGEMLSGLGGAIDVIVPRGGKSLIERIYNESRIPVVAHLDGVCHTYVHATADLAMAKTVCLNAKLRRPSVCNAMETMLVDAAVAKRFLPDIARDFAAAQCELRGCERTQDIISCAPATEEDWRTEYLDKILSIKIVDSLDEAIEHINEYGSHHSDAIITESYSAAERFLDEVDSAAVFVNASTYFHDGFQFGLGAELGISTSKLHCRGPMALKELTSLKWVVRGNGQIRT